MFSGKSGGEAEQLERDYFVCGKPSNSSKTDAMRRLS